LSKTYSKEEIETLINSNEIFLMYFESDTCKVCKVIKPELNKILKAYPKLKSIFVNVEGNIKLAASYSVFTLPAILVFVNGKESIREARYINLEEIESKISRYYKFMEEC
jgi:thiol-disulfide isomerase/thioredoxin